MGEKLTPDEVQVAPEDAAQIIYDLRRRVRQDAYREWATVYERVAWQHDIGKHKDSEFPYQFCPRCEMEHPKGRFRTLAAAAQAVLDKASPPGVLGDSPEIAALRLALGGESCAVGVPSN